MGAACPDHPLLVHSICASDASTADAPAPWEESDESEEEQHNAWNQLPELFTFQRYSNA